MTRRHLQKARNIAANPAVSLVVPLMRRLLWFLPPPTIQLRGRAEILDWTDEDGTDVFSHFWMGRRILEAYRASHRRGETRICFLRITPDPVVNTYMVGYRHLGAQEAHGVGSRQSRHLARVVADAQIGLRGGDALRGGHRGDWIRWPGTWRPPRE